ncbi:chemotaxis protein CheX [Acidobacteria bacterium AB60]|nr:chemotaxis protein CheX [Acidobacteria bacterium AB60]
MTTLRLDASLISNAARLDASVDEVFQLMVGVRCRPGAPPAETAADSVTAMVGFGGALTGACVLSCPPDTARAIAARMTGTHFAVLDDTVRDAMGEVCNMIAGTWKGNVPELASACELSVPAVITGRDYQLRVQEPRFTVRRAYRFAESFFLVTLLCDDLR